MGRTWGRTPRRTPFVFDLADVPGEGAGDEQDTTETATAQITDISVSLNISILAASIFTPSCGGKNSPKSLIYTLM